MGKLLGPGWRGQKLIVGIKRAREIVVLVMSCEALIITSTAIGCRRHLSCSRRDNQDREKMDDANSKAAKGRKEGRYTCSFTQTLRCTVKIKTPSMP